MGIKIDQCLSFVKHVDYAKMQRPKYRFYLNVVCIVNTLEDPEEEKHRLSGYLLKIKKLN